MVTEVFLEDIEKIVLRYREIGIYAPKLIKTKSAGFIYTYTREHIVYRCYVEECAPYKLYKSPIDGSMDYTFRKSVVEHMGKLAKKFSNEDLSLTRSMWSLIELGPFDVDKDEKQENIDRLSEALRVCRYDERQAQLIKMNTYHRMQIEKYLQQLPRCVYQGDLNESNILVDEQGNFSGIIDFNMFGTEVNINCFLNETMYYLECEDFETLSAKEIFRKMNLEQNQLLKGIIKEYPLNALERAMWQHYRKIIYMSFYPNTILLVSLLSESEYVDKVLELLDLILRM